MVGEIRDGETAKISIEAALTGHLVLSTLHTNDAPSAITRLNEMGVEPFLDRLRRLGRARAAARAQALPPLLRALLAVGRGAARRPASRPTSPPPRDGIGLLPQGRLPALQPDGLPRPDRHLPAADDDRGDRDARRRRRRAATRSSARRCAAGMRTMWDDGLAKVAAGLTSIEELARVVCESERRATRRCSRGTAARAALPGRTGTPRGGREAVGPRLTASPVGGVDLSLDDRRAFVRIVVAAEHRDPAPVPRRLADELGSSTGVERRLRDRGLVGVAGRARPRSCPACGRRARRARRRRPSSTRRSGRRHCRARRRARRPARAPSGRPLLPGRARRRRPGRPWPDTTATTSLLWRRAFTRGAGSPAVNRAVAGATCFGAAGRVCTGVRTCVGVTTVALFDVECPLYEQEDPRCGDRDDEAGEGDDLGRQRKVERHHPSYRQNPPPP